MKKGKWKKELWKTWPGRCDVCSRSFNLTGTLVVKCCSCMKLHLNTSVRKWKYVLILTVQSGTVPMFVCLFAAAVVKSSLLSWQVEMSVKSFCVFFSICVLASSLVSSWLKCPVPSERKSRRLNRRSSKKKKSSTLAVWGQGRTGKIKSSQSKHLNQQLRAQRNVTHTFLDFCLHSLTM